MKFEKKGEKTKITLVIADVNICNGQEEVLLPQLAPQYVEKYHSHKNPVDKQQELTAGYLLKKYLGVDKDSRLTKNRYGKPAPASGKIQFNLSHSGTYVALAIAEEAVGVDIEQVRPYHRATAKKVFDEKTYSQLESLLGESRDRKFTELWTRLEAALKFRGTGFGEPLSKEQPTDCGIVTFWPEEDGDCCISCAAASLTDSSGINFIIEKNGIEYQNKKTSTE